MGLHAPQLNFSNMESINQIMTNCTQISVHPCHPYSGDLVLTSFSGSHQNSTNKCLQAKKNEIWTIPYLTPKILERHFNQFFELTHSLVKLVLDNPRKKDSYKNEN